ncbi:MAG TPA: hypothetical protein VI968_04545 [archaeon]|nr:hypothetical protein [archaeon]
MASLPIKVIVVVILVVLILSVLAAFFLLQSGQQVSEADAQRIFNAECQDYAAQSCSWDVTRSPSFGAYLQACKRLYGQEREAFSCLYAMCQPCKEFNVPQTKCAGLCKACQANADIGISVTSCCSEFTSQCTGIIECNTCAGV